MLRLRMVMAPRHPLNAWMIGALRYHIFYTHPIFPENISDTRATAFVKILVCGRCLRWPEPV